MVMSGRRTAIQIVTKTAMVIAALFLVSVLLAAMPGHHAPVVGSWENSGSNAATNISSGIAADAEANAPQGDHASMGGMKMSGDENSTESQAVEEMGAEHNSHSLHMHMTTMRPQMPGDEQRAREIVATLRTAI